jgi:hypothetical protein
MPVYAQVNEFRQRAINLVRPDRLGPTGGLRHCNVTTPRGMGAERHQVRTAWQLSPAQVSGPLVL